MFSCTAAVSPLDAFKGCALAGDSKPPVSGFVEEIRPWASQLAAESRVPGWVAKSYVWPEELSPIWDHLEDMRGGV